MTNDPSMTISISVAPAPAGSDNTGNGGNTIPLPVAEGVNAPPASDALTPDMIKTIDGTTFEVYFHFSQTSQETFTDKVLRLIQAETVTSKM